MENSIKELIEWLETLVSRDDLITKFNIKNEDAEYYTSRYRPIIKINDYTKEELKTQLSKLKQEFINTNGVFDYDIFENKKINFMKFRFSEYYRLFKNHRFKGTINNYNSYRIQSEAERKTNYDTLLLSQKNDIQLELHFKMTLQAFTEFESEHKTQKTEQTENKKTNNIKSDLKFKFTQTELVELTKALIDNKNIQGTQVKIFEYISEVFNTEINNEDQKIQNIKGRNNGSETIFLDKLKNKIKDLTDKK